MVLDNFIPPMLEAVLADYQRCAVPSARYYNSAPYLKAVLRSKPGLVWLRLQNTSEWGSSSSLKKGQRDNVKGIIPTFF